MLIVHTPGSKAKLVGGIILAAVLLVGGGYAAGRHSAPAKVVTQEKVVTQVDTQTILNEIANLKQSIAQLQTVAQQKDVHTVRVIERDPNGVTKTTVTTDDHSKTDTSTETQTHTADQVQTQAKTDTQTKQTEEKTVTVINKAEAPWSLSLQPGFNFAQALGSGSPYSLLPTSNPYLKYGTIGLSVEHRFVGPLSLGLWANTNGAGGLTLRLDL